MHAKKDNTVSFCQDERFLAVKVVVSAVKKEDILNGGYHAGHHDGAEKAGGL